MPLAVFECMRVLSRDAQFRRWMTEVETCVAECFHAGRNSHEHPREQLWE